MHQTDAWTVKKARIVFLCRSGFDNPGAMCYLNAVLQFMFASDDCLDAVRPHTGTDACNEHFIGCLLHVSEQQTAELEAVSTRPWYSILESWLGTPQAPASVRVRTQDAHDVLADLLLCVRDWVCK